LEKIKKEIAILKKCNHPHIVRLFEVIDDPRSDKIYLGKKTIHKVFEYLPGGELLWHTNDLKPLYNEDQVRKIFRDIVAGVQYCNFFIY
jgi:[calcium/calmodulin-dependent protein kinase] kinase